MRKPILHAKAFILANFCLGGCASQSNLCEDILEVKAQEQQCEVLQKAIRNPKNPQMALTARQRFENECVNFRYYRDEYDTICKGKEQPISQPVLPPDKQNQ